MELEIIKIDFYNRDLGKQAYELFYHQPGKKFQESFFLNKENYLYVAVLDEKVVGSIYGYELDRMDTPLKNVMIYSIDVLKDYQRQGIGKRLIHAFLNPFRFGKHDKAFVLTNSKNENTMMLYTKTGAKAVHSDLGEPVLFEYKLH